MAARRACCSPVSSPPRLRPIRPLRRGSTAPLTTAVCGAVRMLARPGCQSVRRRTTFGLRRPGRSVRARPRPFRWSPRPTRPGGMPSGSGTEPSSLYRSSDHGETFEKVAPLDLPSRKTWSFPPRPDTHHVQCIAHGGEGAVHVAIEFGAMLRSVNGGRSFADRLADSPLDTHALQTHPAAPARLYAALGDALADARAFLPRTAGTAATRWQ